MKVKIIKDENIYVRNPIDWNEVIKIINIDGLEVNFLYKGEMHSRALRKGNKFSFYGSTFMIIK